MVKEQASLHVELHNSKRKKSLQRPEFRTIRPCPVHHATKSQSASEIIEEVESKIDDLEAPSTHFTGTPHLSRNELTVLDRNMGKIKISQVRSLLEKAVVKPRGKSRQKTRKNK